MSEEEELGFAIIRNLDKIKYNSNTDDFEICGAKILIKSQYEIRVDDINIYLGYGHTKLVKEAFEKAKSNRVRYLIERIEQ